jgi:hypothetical protein
MRTIVAASFALTCLAACAAEGPAEEPLAPAESAESTDGDEPVASQSAELLTCVNGFAATSQTVTTYNPFTCAPTTYSNNTNVNCPFSSWRCHVTGNTYVVQVFNNGAWRQASDAVTVNPACGKIPKISVKDVGYCGSP